MMFFKWFFSFGISRWNWLYLCRERETLMWPFISQPSVALVKKYNYCIFFKKREEGLEESDWFGCSLHRRWPMRLFNGAKSSKNGSIRTWQKKISQWHYWKRLCFCRWNWCNRHTLRTMILAHDILSWLSFANKSAGKKSLLQSVNLIINRYNMIWITVRHG